ncbi:MAG: thiamine pyrophosphate-dependent enzyme, partial [Acidobacteriota bacterium]|nr:thiamine pyrophosphate-dependent enzyme [Acidobacteriota bacterium]
GTKLLNPDFVRLADSFGAIGLRAEPEDLGSALQEALAAKRPVVLEIIVPNWMPPFHLVEGK